MSLANISIVGNLARAPEQFQFANGRSKTTLVIAVNSFNKIRKEKSTDFYRVETWDRLADLAINYLKKGNQVTVSGRLALEKWTDREGKDRVTPTVQANQLAFPPRLRPDPLDDTPPEPAIHVASNATTRLEPPPPATVSPPPEQASEPHLEEYFDQEDVSIDVSDVDVQPPELLDAMPEDEEEADAVIRAPNETRFRKKTA